MSCEKCGLQYVGETGRVLHIRVSGQHTNFQKKGGIRGTHFSKESYNFNIPIIEKITPDQNHNEGKLKSKWQERELFWQKELGTMWPFGSNT